MKTFLTRETMWTMAGSTLFFAGAATAILAAPIVSTVVQNAVSNTPRSNNAGATTPRALPVRPVAGGAARNVAKGRLPVWLNLDVKTLPLSPGTE